MIPRTALMAQEVAAQFTTTELDDYGNIILNGYATVGPNTTSKMSWAWPDSPLLPAVPLPTVTAVNPVLKGWTTNYEEYYTKLQPNGYGVNPGDPTMFNYNVHSNVPPTYAKCNVITALGPPAGGSGYTPGTYYSVALTGGSGLGAAATVTVAAPSGGAITSLGGLVAGTCYTPGTYTNVALTGGSGTGAQATIVVDPPSGGTITALNNLVQGSGYVPGTYTNVPLTGGTPGENATATIVVAAPVPVGAITGFCVLTSPSNYYFAGWNCNLTTTGGSGTGAKVDLFVKLGAITGLTFTTPGAGYPPLQVFYGVPTTAASGTGECLKVDVVSNITGIIYTGCNVPSSVPNGYGGCFGGGGYQVGDIIGVNPVNTAQFQVTSVNNAIGAGTAIQPTPGSAGCNYQVGDTISFGFDPGQPALKSTAIVASVQTVADPGGYVCSVVLTSGGQFYTAGSTLSAALPGGNGFSIDVATATPYSANQCVKTVTLTSGGQLYQNAEVLSASIPGGNGFSINVTGTTPFNPGGYVSNVTLTSFGTNYAVGNVLTGLLPAGNGWSVTVTGVASTAAVPNGESRWGQSPRRRFQNTVSTTTPPQYVNNPAAIQYSFIYPVGDRTSQPPIGPLS